jgi:S1-C subfamily serine protease
MSSVYGQPEPQPSGYQPGSPGYYYLPPGGSYPGPWGPGYQQPPPPPPPRRRRHRALAAAAATVLAFGAGAGLANWASGGTVLGGLASGRQLSTASIVSMTDPAVVDVVSTLGDSGQGAEAAGTGIVLTSDGEVLTNNHVIDGATSIRVTDVGNGETYRATVAGYDATHDIAVLRLAGASGLKTATIGSSATVRPGQKIVALGNAGGKGGTPSVAEGEVTALDQSITASDEGSGTSERLTGMIQTSADIQPGDSGGPALNTSGQVIGMDTAASSGESQTGTVQAFAIPISQAIATVRQIDSGTATATVHIGRTAFLGVGLSTTGGGFGTQASGAAVAEVVPGTAAATAGLAEGDVITSVGGRPVTSANSLRDAMTSHHPGDTVTITWQDQLGQQQSARVVLGTGPAD